MKTFFYHSIRNRLTLITFTVSVLTMLLGYSSIAYLDIRNQHRDLKENALLQARVTGHHCLDLWPPGNIEDLQRLLRNLDILHYIHAAAVYDTSNQRLAAYSRTDAALHALEAGTTPSPDPGALHVTEPIYDRGNHILTIHLQVSSDAVQKKIKYHMLILIVLMAITATLALLLASRLHASISKPLLQLANIARHISKTKDYSVQAHYESNDEIGMLYTGFNEMIKHVATRETERNLAEAALRESEEKYRTLFTSINDPILIYNLETQQIIDCNQPALQQYGYTLEELLQKTPASLQVNKTEAFTSPQDNGITQYRHVSKQGDYFDVEVVTAHLIYHKQPACMCIIRDISNRISAEKTLRQTRNDLQNILDSMPSILIGLDQCGQITQWGKEAEKHTDRNAESVMGKPLDSVIPELHAMMPNILQAIENKEILKESHPCHFSKASLEHMDMTVYPLIIKGVQGAVLRIDDVTDRKRMEEIMIQSEKMLSVGGLAAGMAHEINNPLAGMMQNVQVIHNRLFEDLPANRNAAQKTGVAFDTIRNYMHLRKIEPMIEAVMDSGRNAAKIVDNMLSFSRKSDSRMLEQNMATLMDQVLNLAANDYNLKKKYDFKRININRIYQDNMPLVRCDPGKIQQVMLNVLKNGAQAMAEATRDHQPPQFTLRILEQGHMARIEITDNGPGMTEAIRRRVFEPFFTTKPVGIGTGLGLSVSYFIITENHDGQMKVQSTPGQGSTFIVELPLHRAEEDVLGTVSDEYRDHLTYH